jgi:hypothetical protein
MINKSPDEVLLKTRTRLDEFNDIKELNEFLENKTGIIDFFKSFGEFNEFRKFLDDPTTFNAINHDLGDFQTPLHLTDKICEYLVGTGFTPDALIEPTCGGGNFVVSAIKFFPTLKYVYCVDVQKRYEWLFKLNMLKLSFHRKIPITIEFYRDNIFIHQFSHRFLGFLDSQAENLLILGNPPWVTSSELSVLNSDNLPPKANIKKNKGIEAITGKGNFDIAENIILQMIQRFRGRKGKIAMLCKTSVIKNIVRDIPKLNLEISNIQEFLIDAPKEFNINADSALFVLDLSLYRDTFCIVSSLYKPRVQLKKFGWIRDNFVSDMELYEKYGYLDGRSPFEWRQGVKHDATSVMILKVTKEGLFNNLGEYVEIEEDLLYPFVRGSHLRRHVIRDTANKIILTQTSLQEDTTYIEQKYPKTWNYLICHSEYLDIRRSMIYKKRPKFSIFGIGDYSFMPYKVGISGLYKKPNFSLILPVDNKPVMLDDTCYYLSFDSLNSAFFTWILLNTDEVTSFLSAIAFLDSKRPYTKDILMRIDLHKLAEIIPFDHVFKTYQKEAKNHLEYEFTVKHFIEFKNSLEKGNSLPDLFARQASA